jgi:omega-6 fatty acid desaturase (delta-12 desaturase)
LTREGWRPWLSAMGTNAAAAVIVLLLLWLGGWQALVFVYLPTLLMAASVGVWLFYIQHQFEDAYWERGEDWDYLTAALQGSSFYKLPKVLQWFSGNIGFHHIHHLSPRIPNYNLEQCHKSDPMFHDVQPMTLLGSLRSLGLRLWDESSKKLVGYRHLRQVKDAPPPDDPSGAKGPGKPTP